MRRSSKTQRDSHQAVVLPPPRATMRLIWICRRNRYPAAFVRAAPKKKILAPRGCEPPAGLSVASSEMSETQRSSQAAPRRESSDFSIERILSKDASRSPSSTNSSCAASSSVTSGQTCACLLHGSDVVCESSTRSFVVENKLDWLRNFRRLQQTSRSDSKGDEVKTERLANSAETFKSKHNTDLGHFNGEELAWLRCTRYRPPKLPRKSCSGKSVKRKPGAHPRIPFTKYQLEVLEDKYKSSAYLSRKDVIHLSDLLQLPQTRIKIWFQNRRARERRESQTLEQIQTIKV